MLTRFRTWWRKLGEPAKVCACCKCAFRLGEVEDRRWYIVGLPFCAFCARCYVGILGK